MRSLIGSALVVVGILSAVAAVGIAAKGGAGASDEAVAYSVVRWHLASCDLCQRSGLTITQLAEPERPSPCGGADQARD